MEAIRVTVEQLLRDLKSGPRQSESEHIWRSLQRFFSQAELEHVWLSSLRNGIVTLKVDSSSWLYFFKIKKQRDMNAAQIPGVRTIRFALGTAHK